MAVVFLKFSEKLKPMLFYFKQEIGSTVGFKPGFAAGLLLIFAFLFSGCSQVRVEPERTFPTRPMDTRVVETPELAQTDWLLETAPIETIPPSLAVPSAGLVTPPVFSCGAETWVMVSPDKNWRAVLIYEQLEWESHILLYIEEISGKQKITLLDETQSGSGISFPQLKHWSEDSRYFYFLAKPAATGCKNLYSIDTVWRRVDIQDGSQTEFQLPPGTSHSLSPDDSWLAYVALDQPLRLVMIERETNRIVELPLLADSTERMNSQAGDILWSPDQKKLVIAVASDSLCGLSRPEFSVLKIDLGTNQVTALISGSSDWLRPIEWRTQDRILLRDSRGFSWWIDAQSGNPVSAP